VTCSTQTSVIKYSKRNLYLPLWMWLSAVFAGDRDNYWKPILFLVENFILQLKKTKQSYRTPVHLGHVLLLPYWKNVMTPAVQKGMYVKTVQTVLSNLHSLTIYPRFYRRRIYTFTYMYDRWPDVSLKPSEQRSLTTVASMRLMCAVL